MSFVSGKRRQPFKQQFQFQARQIEAERILKKYGNERVPVIVDMSQQCTLAPLDNRKFLVPRNLTVGQFIFVLRKRMQLSSDEAIFLFFDNTLFPTNSLLSDIYTQYKDGDGFLYCLLTQESTMG
jgi:GABA(A) receptor-associated protein